MVPVRGQQLCFYRRHCQQPLERGRVGMVQLPMAILLLRRAILSAIFVGLVRSGSKVNLGVFRSRLTTVNNSIAKLSHKRIACAIIYAKDTVPNVLIDRIPCLANILSQRADSFLPPCLLCPFAPPPPTFTLFITPLPSFSVGRSCGITHSILSV